MGRIEALLRRSPQAANNSPAAFRFGDVAVDFRRAEVLKNNQPLELSTIEFKLPQFLIENGGAVHSRDRLLNEVWGCDAMPTTRTVDVHSARLGQKLETNPKHPQFIRTVHGLGYKFVS